MTRVGIVGISGYSGCALLEILLKHPEVRITYVSANNTQGRVEDIWPHLKGRTKLICKKFDLKKAVAFDHHIKTIRGGLGVTRGVNLLSGDHFRTRA